jgi:tRNA modification GTPase
VISHPCIVHGVPLTLADTAGWRAARTSVERDGIRRSANAAAAADLVLVVLDGSRPLGADDEAVLAETGPSAVLAVNKADLPETWGLTALGDRAASATRLSARTGAGLEDLRTRLARALVGDDRLLDDVRVTNVRHARLLEVAREALGRASRQAGAAGAEELVVSDLREALGALAEVTGKRAPDAVLREIFSRFCIGK